MSGIDSWAKWEAALAQGQSIQSILQLEESDGKDVMVGHLLPQQF